jgi:prolyl-tRNA synthetase
MAHSDDQGLILPPKIAPLQVVIVPIFKNEEQLNAITEKVTTLMAELKQLNIRVKYDATDHTRPGWKFAEYELKGVPVRLAIGGRDLENNTVEVARRDEKTKATVRMDGLSAHLVQLLKEIQDNMYQKAKTYRDSHITNVDTWEEFVSVLNEKGGFVAAHWDGTAETEAAIKEQSKATIRCIPLNNTAEAGACILTGKPSSQRVLFALAY